MTIAAWLLAHHIVVLLVALGFASSVLSERRPSGSAFAWLLIIFLIPYIGIPLYLSFGGRKLLRQRGEKAKLEPVANAIAHAEKLEWLDDGVAAYQRFRSEIDGATRSIRIVTFVIGSDETGRSLVEALTRRAAAGVEVQLLIDDLLRREAPRDELARLVAAGGRVVRFMPLWHIPFRGHDNLRNHRKIAVFDGERAIVGGMNLADEYMGPSPSETRWRDLSIVVSGEPAKALEAIFCADWRFATGERAPVQALEEKSDPSKPALTEEIAPRETMAPPTQNSRIPLQIIPSGPDAESDPIYDALLTALFRAEKRFWISTPYFVPDETLVRALAVAARRGVDVRVVVPEHSNHHLADIVSGPYLRGLREAGVDIQRYAPGMLHAKALLVDSKLAVVGSANFDMRSLFLNYEIALFFSGPAEVSRLAAWFEATAQRTHAGVPEAGRIRRRAEEVLRLFAPLL